MNIAAERKRRQTSSSITARGAKTDAADQHFRRHGGRRDQENKLFAFINYEGRRDASAGAPTTVPTVPSDLMRAGILQYVTTSAVSLR